MTPSPAHDDISWRADRPLTWDDFRGPVSRQAAPDRVAMTAASLSWGYEYKIERSDSDCAYRITNIHSQAIFDRRRSWVKPEHRNTAVLSHEQGHFDLTQIYKRILDRRAAEIVGARNACEGRSIEEASKFTKRDAADRVQRLFDDVWSEYLSTQEAYDEQTQHGIETAAQRQWSGSIHAGLLAGRWSGPTG